MLDQVGRGPRGDMVDDIQHLVVTGLTLVAVTCLSTTWLAL